MIRDLLIAIAVFGLAWNSTAGAELYEATWSGKITDSVSSGISPYLGWFDDLSSLDSADIIEGATVSGTVLIDTLIAPPDEESAADLAIFRYFGQPIDVAPRFLTLSLTLAGNIFRPATEPRPIEQIDSSPPSSALQMVIRDQTPVGGPTAELRFTDGWNTYFGGVLHDRSIHLNLWNMPFIQDLPSPNEDFSGGFGYGSAGVLFGDQGIPNSYFHFTIVSVSDFTVVPLPISALLLIAPLALIVRRRSKMNENVVM